MRNRRVSIVALVTVLLFASGCQMARAGSRCSPGASPARDASHVLFCQGGRWRKTVTIQQATDIIVARIPSRIEAETGAVLTVGQTSAIPVSFAVTSPNFRFVPGVMVDVSIDNSGGTDVSTTGVSFVTGANGRIEVPLRAGTRSGDAFVTARVAGVTEPARARVKIWPGTFDRVVVVSGEGQSAPAGQPFAPLVLRAVDQFGNGVLGTPVQILIEDRRSFSMPLTRSNIVSGDQGLLSVPVTAGLLASRLNDGSSAPMIVRVQWRLQELSVPFTVVAGPPSSFSAIIIDPTATVGTDFLPIGVVVADVYGNAIGGALVGVEAIPSSGASGIVPSTVVTDNTGFAFVNVAANAVAGSWTLRLTVAGREPLNRQLTNTP